jgi:hypothetical protein
MLPQGLMLQLDYLQPLWRQGRPLDHNPDQGLAGPDHDPDRLVGLGLQGGGVGDHRLRAQSSPEGSADTTDHLLLPGNLGEGKPPTSLPPAPSAAPIISPKPTQMRAVTSPAATQRVSRQPESTFGVILPWILLLIPALRAEYFEAIFNGPYRAVNTAFGDFLGDDNMPQDDYDTAVTDRELAAALALVNTIRRRKAKSSKGHHHLGQQHRNAIAS